MIEGGSYVVLVDLKVADSSCSFLRLQTFSVRTDNQFPLDGTQIGRMLVMILGWERIPLV